MSKNTYKILGLLLAILVGIYLFGGSRWPSREAGESSTEKGGDIAVIADEHDTLGKILTGVDGMTLYTFLGDEVGKSNCYEECADSWIPLSAVGEPRLGAGVSGTVGTIQRAGGIRQVTYNGMPLYLWVNDQEPGEATGNGVNDVWFAAKP